MFLQAEYNPPDSSKTRWIFFLERLAAKSHDPGDTWVQIVCGIESRFLDTVKGIDPLLEG